MDEEGQSCFREERTGGQENSSGDERDTRDRAERSAGRRRNKKSGRKNGRDNKDGGTGGAPSAAGQGARQMKKYKDGQPPPCLNKVCAAAGGRH